MTERDEELASELRLLLARLEEGTLNSGDRALLEFCVRRPDRNSSECCKILGHDGETLFALVKGRGTGKSDVHRAYHVAEPAMIWFDPARQNTPDWTKS